jgi:hypothetical protein
LLIILMLFEQFFNKYNIWIKMPLF